MARDAQRPSAGSPRSVVNATPLLSKDSPTRVPVCRGGMGETDHLGSQSHWRLAAFQCPGAKNEIHDHFWQLAYLVRPTPWRAWSAEAFRIPQSEVFAVRMAGGSQGCAYLWRGGGGGGSDLAPPPPPRPNHPPTQNQNNFPSGKNEILNREPQMRGFWYTNSFFALRPPPTPPPPRSRRRNNKYNPSGGTVRSRVGLPVGGSGSMALGSMFVEAVRGLEEFVWREGW